MGPLTDLWFGACAAGGGGRSTLPLTRIQTFIEDLRKAGLEMPSRREAARLLESVVPAGEAPPESGGPRAVQYTFEALVELVWAPLAAIVDACVESKQPGSAGLSEEAQRNLEYLSLELDGLVLRPQETRAFEDWLGDFQKILEGFAGTRPPAKFTAAVVGLLVPLVFPTTPAAAYLLAGSSVASALLGRSLGSHCHRRAIAFVADLRLEVPLPTAEILAKGVPGDLVEALARLWGPQALEEEAAPAEEDAGSPSGSRKRPSRTAANLRLLLAERTDQIRWALKHRLAIKHIPDALGEALELFSAEAEADELLKPPAGPAGVSHWTLMRHLVLLDGALDRWLSEDINESRVSGSFGGICLSTDESPPEAGRFGGLRFQVTFVYIATFADADDWDLAGKPPVRSTAILADVVHNPGKRGEDLLAVLDKQLGRLGLLRADVVSCTTDGGGENVGQGGIHKLLESDNPSYVPRRCLPHLAWRAADAAINCCTERLGPYKTLAAYFSDGVTWSRLRTIAVTAPEAGGLGLFGEHSPACKRIFHRAPGVVISTRPQTDMKVLEFLRGKEGTLFVLAERDCAQRRLGPGTSQTIQTLKSESANIARGILAEVIHRSLFLMFWATKKNKVAAETSWDALMAQASQHLLTVEMDDEVLRRLGLTGADLERKGWRPSTWVELVVLMLTAPSDGVAPRDRLAEAFEFHRLVTDKAASHLSLTQDNLARTHWLAARLLSSSASEAQASAKDLARRIASTSPANRTLFEGHLFDTAELWTELEAFGHATPAVPLWKGRRRFENLFRFLAPRFLVGPDHVLDCERQHARWQWLCGAKRGLKMPGLNGFLKCTSYLEKHEGHFPPNEALEEHLEASRAQLRWDLQEASRDEDLAPGWRQEQVWASRFNLRAADHGPLELAPAQAPRQDTTFEARWRNYLRGVLRRGAWFLFASRPSAPFYVAENKVVAGREARGEGEAVGRNLAVVFFEPLGAPAAGEAMRVRRVHREGTAMAPKLLTIAEIMRNSGILLPDDPLRTAADSETLLEDAFAGEDLRRFTGRLETEALEAHVYSLVDEVPAELAFLEEQPPEALSKMALARLLELREHGSRRELFPLSLNVLRGRAVAAGVLGGEVIAPPAAAPPAPAGRARGRGGKGARGRGRPNPGR